MTYVAGLFALSFSAFCLGLGIGFGLRGASLLLHRGCCRD